MADKRLDDGTFAHEIVADDIIVLERVNKPIEPTIPEELPKTEPKPVIKTEPVIVTETIEVITETKEVK